MTKIQCPDCQELVTPAVWIPTCRFNPDGMLTTTEHETCEDDFCNPDEFEMEQQHSKEDFESYYYRCPECSTLNIDQPTRQKEKEAVN